MKLYLRWFAALVIVTIIFGTIYTTVQQSLRLSANDPQIQLAEDAATHLDANTSILSIVGENQIDIAKSLAPFTVIYDQNGKPVAGSGYLDHRLAMVPKGILTSSQGKEYNFVTWEPRLSVRIAAVAVKANKYFVVSGRNLREVEKRENTVMWLSFAGWVMSLVAIAVYEVLTRLIKRKL
jgi:hypothetical protein